MSCGIIEGQTGGTGDPVEVFYCSTDGRAFGPVMGEGEGQLFQDWLARRGVQDPRHLDVGEITDAWQDFQTRPAPHLKVVT